MAAPDRETGCPMPNTTNASPQVANASPQLANAERQYTVSRKDLPLSCPTPAMSLWHSHPRVYLPIEADRKSGMLGKSESVSVDLGGRRNIIKNKHHTDINLSIKSTIQMKSK